MPDPGCNPELPPCSANSLIYGAPAAALWLFYSSFLTDRHGVIVASMDAEIKPGSLPSPQALQIWVWLWIIPRKLLSLGRHEMLVLSNCHPPAVAPFSSTSQSLVDTPHFPVRDQLLELLYEIIHYIPESSQISSSSIIVATLPFAFGRVLLSTDWPVTYCAAQVVTELTEICLPLVLKMCKYHPTQPFYSFLVAE